MFARVIVNRKWMVAAGVAAILALVIGAAIGRSIIPSGAAHRPVTAPKAVRFVDKADGLSLAYPADWKRRPTLDAQVRLLAALAPAASLSLRVTKTKLAVTPQNVTVPVVRRFTDDLLAADQRTKLLAEPVPVTLGRLPGYRYIYTYIRKDGTTGAHVHYFLFKRGLLIQLVLQAVPATTLPPLQATFSRIAGSLTSR